MSAISPVLRAGGAGTDDGRAQSDSAADLRAAGQGGFTGRRGLAAASRWRKDAFSLAEDKVIRTDAREVGRNELPECEEM